ncbi:tyrosine-type recombinase/integrase [Leptolyngbya sp. 15MV]|nr:tyrosine-type recombinase/integrase [Leptolyngbya sp. 15MV]
MHEPNIKRVVRQGRVYAYWTPPRGFEAAFRRQRLPDDPVAALAQARAWNAALAAHAKTLHRDPEAKPPSLAPLPSRTDAPTHAPGTLGAYWESFERSRAFLIDLAPITRAEMRRTKRIVLALLGDVALAALTERHIEDLYRTLTDGFRSRITSSNTHLRYTRRVLSWACKEAGLPVNPARGIRLINAMKQVPPWSAEAASILPVVAAEMGEPGLAAMIRINVIAGQRPADLRGLTMANLDGTTLRIEQRKVRKHGTGRVAIDLTRSPPALAALHDWLAVRARILADATPATRAASRERLFLRRNGLPWHHKPFHAAWAALRAQAASMVRERAEALPPEARKAALAVADELDVIVLRATRHTAVVRLSEAGAEIPEIVAVTGHTLASAHTILKHYLTVTERQASNALDKLARAQSAATPVAALLTRQEPGDRT